MRLPGPSVPPPPLLLLLLLLGCCLVGASPARRNQASPRGASAPLPGPAGGSAGRFSAGGQLACGWQILLPAPGGAAGGELAVSCRGPDGARWQCAYRGEPQRCAAYRARGPQYWKQVVGKLRKKERPCHDPAPLRARLCGGKKGQGAELHLVPPGQGQGRSQARAREPAPEEPSGTPAPAGAAKKKGRGGKRKESPPSDEQRPVQPGPAPARPLELNEELTETYCAEKWHSLCNFFVNFWNG